MPLRPARTYFLRRSWSSRQRGIPKRLGLDSAGRAATAARDRFFEKRPAPRKRAHPRKWGACATNNLKRKNDAKRSHHVLIAVDSIEQLVHGRGKDVQIGAGEECFSRSDSVIA